MYYEEIFCSIQGEGLDAGLPCIFIRLYGCPIGCSYCDQKQDKSSKKSITIDRIIKKVVKYKGVKRVCITGGEPLIQKDDVFSLTWELLGMDYDVSIETSGCIPLEDLGYKRSFKYVMDVKCPSSGVSDKNILFNLMKLQYNDEVKFVIADKKDYDYMKGILKKNILPKTILVSPVFDEKGSPVIGEDLVSWILRDKLNVRVQVQMHKILGVR